MLSSHPDLINVSSRTWIRELQSLGVHVNVYVEQRHARELSFINPHVISSRIHPCNDRVCHHSFAIKRAIVEHAFISSARWKVLLLLDDDVLICPHTFIKLVHSIANISTHVYGGWWFKDAQRYIADEHSLWMGREFVQQLLVSYIGIGDPAYEFDADFSFSAQCVYWAIKWNFHLVDMTEYDTGFLSGIDSSPYSYENICAKFAIVHKLKTANEMGAIKYNVLTTLNKSASFLEYVEFTPTSVFHNRNMRLLPHLNKTLK